VTPSAAPADSRRTSLRLSSGAAFVGQRRHVSLPIWPVGRKSFLCVHGKARSMSEETLAMCLRKWGRAMCLHCVSCFFVVISYSKPGLEQQINFCVKTKSEERTIKPNAKNRSAHFHKDTKKQRPTIQAIPASPTSPANSSAQRTQLA